MRRWNLRRSIKFAKVAMDLELKDTDDMTWCVSFMSNTGQVFRSSLASNGNTHSPISILSPGQSLPST